MIEAFLVAIVIFVAYIIYSIVIQPNRAAAKAASLNPSNQQKAAAQSKPAKPSAKEPAKQDTVAKTKTESAPEALEAITVLRNPKTKETANVPNNYRFAKRWIKEALVEEGLLDKIYKNNELDDAVNEKVKEAIDQLKALKKYQG
jgi:hypothetical protein